MSNIITPEIQVKNLDLFYGDNQALLSQMMAMSETQLASALDYNLNDDALLSIYNNYISTGSYDDNMKSFGVVSLDAPSSINIYCDSFEDKDVVADYIKKYNESVSDEYKITYTDYVGLLMSSVTTIINVISDTSLVPTILWIYRFFSIFLESTFNQL